MKNEKPLTLSILPQRLAVCRLESQVELPTWCLTGTFLSITRTTEELSIVCAEELIPTGMVREGGWRALKVEGPLDFSLTGILAGIAQSLAQAEISLFAISTYDTDYILVREKDIQQAVAALITTGYAIRDR